MSMGKIYGYMRISTSKESQKTDRQLITLQDYAKANGFSFHKIVEERISGTVKTDNRPVYFDLKERLDEGDTLIVTDVDRLGRDADNIIYEFKELKNKGIKVIALDIPFLSEWNKVQDNSMYNMIADIFITLKAHIAQQDREKMVSRINQGINAAKAKGVKLGRPKVILPESFIKEYTRFREGRYGDMTALGFAKMIGIGRATLYKYINIYEDENKI